MVPHMRDEALWRLETSLLSHHKLLSPPLDASDFEGWPISVVNLARTFDLPKLLPGAFYLCSQLPVPVLIHGTKRANGDVDRLEEADLSICLQGRDKLIARSVQISAKILRVGEYELRTKCSDSGTCTTRVKALYTPVKLANPRAICLRPDSSTRLCQSCLLFWTKFFSDEAAHTWGLLGGYFESPPSPGESPGLATTS